MKKKRKRFPLRCKPKEPKRRQVPCQYNIHDSDTGQAVLNTLLEIQSEGVDLATVCFHCECVYDRHYEEEETWFSYARTETDAELSGRMQDYEKNSKIYATWYAKYGDEAEEERRLQAEEKAADKIKRVERDRKTVLSEMKNLKKRLTALKKKVPK